VGLRELATSGDNLRDSPCFNWKIEVAILQPGEGSHIVIKTVYRHNILLFLLKKYTKNLLYINYII
jgi:hypothetical protein